MEVPLISATDLAIAKLSDILQPVAEELLPIESVLGRVLAAEVQADRDSPALDVSAMDGFAVCLAGLHAASLAQLDWPVQATSAAGWPPLELLPGHAVRIFTGAAVPANANCIIRREDTNEYLDRVRFNLPKESLQVGQNIRRRGENSTLGATILGSGAVINAATIGALASFGAAQIRVQRKVRVAILNTGDELCMPGAEVAAWQIRDSNGPTLEAWLASVPWIEISARTRVADRLEAVREALQAHLENSDAILLTGGVSMGDTDFVPAAIEALGGQIVFHRLPIRPGRPVLGGAFHGKLILGLPGNPVSVAVTSRVIGLPLLQRLGGSADRTQRPMVRLAEHDGKQLDLVWYRLVQIGKDGLVHLVESRGSGDIVSLSHSSGFIEVPVRASEDSPFRLTLW